MREYQKAHPKILCPNCGARLMDAGDKEVKNLTTAEIADITHRYDYLMVCTKCKSYIGIRSNLPRAVTIPLLKNKIVNI
ncbi:MAG: hypothetical protein IJJ41_03840 [Clostridia bacterium]|nr:hypothetical protein [Clostridia bacterium]